MSLKANDKPEVNHVLVDAYGDFHCVEESWLTFLKAVQKTGMTVLGTNFHEFPGGGYTGTVMLAESHAAVHTWPELGYAWAELVTCGDADSLEAFGDNLVELGFADRTEEA